MKQKRIEASPKINVIKEKQIKARGKVCLFFNYMFNKNHL